MTEESGRSALCQAAATGSKSDVEMLLKLGVGVNVTDENGRTPLMLAVIDGHLETVLHLALNGSDLSLTDAAHRTALDFAIDASKKEVTVCNL